MRQVLDQSEAHPLIGRLLDGRQQAIGLERPGALEGIRQDLQLCMGQPGSSQHVGGRGPGSGRLLAVKLTHQVRERSWLEPGSSRPERPPVQPAACLPVPVPDWRWRAGVE